jgi:hypothetical protein
MFAVNDLWTNFLSDFILPLFQILVCRERNAGRRENENRWRMLVLETFNFRAADITRADAPDRDTAGSRSQHTRRNSPGSQNRGSRQDERKKGSERNPFPNDE